jgi:hypothetical protein
MSGELDLAGWPLGLLGWELMRYVFVHRVRQVLGFAAASSR